MKRAILFGILFASLMHPLYSADEGNSKPQQEQAYDQNQNGPVIPEEFKNLEGEQVEPRFFQEFFHMMITLGFIIAAIFILLWLMRRMTNVRIEQTNLKSGVKILERRQISQRTIVYVLSFYGKTVTVAESNNGITLLGEVRENSEKNDDKDNKDI